VNKEVFSTHIMLKSLMLTLEDTMMRADTFAKFYSKMKKKTSSKIYLQSILSQVAFHLGLGGKQ